MDIEAAEFELELLHKQIWQKNRNIHLFPNMCPRPGKDFVNPSKIRNVTEDEVKRAFYLARKYNFPVTIISSFGGASFNLKIFSNHGQPSRRLLSIESSQFPRNQNRTRDKTVYNRMMRLAQKRGNLELLQTHKIPTPRRWSAIVY